MVAIAGVLVPPAPLHTSEKLPLAVKGPMPRLPAVASMPLQPPDAVHPVASVELQVSVEVVPLAIAVGAADSIVVGTGGAAVTVIPAEAEALAPSVLLHVKV
jgi:hypothetical protein